MIESLPRREREVFETLCRLEGGTAAGVRNALTDRLSDSAIRTLLTRLESKGLVAREAGAEGFVYRPVPRTEAVAAGALQRMIDTFFAGSAASAALHSSVFVIPAAAGSAGIAARQRAAIRRRMPPRVRLGRTP